MKSAGMFVVIFLLFPLGSYLENTIRQCRYKSQSNKQYHYGSYIHYKSFKLFISLWSFLLIMMKPSIAIKIIKIPR